MLLRRCADVVLLQCAVAHGATVSVMSRVSARAMTRPSHPQPATLLGRLCPHAPRQLVPIENTADWGTPPLLPSPPRTFPDSSWVLSTHLIPGALPRTTPDIPPVTLPAWTADKETWKVAVKKTAEDMVSVRYKQWSGEMKEPGSRKPLWVCLNRYRRRDLSHEEETRGVTLLFAHANGFPREVSHISWVVKHLSPTCAGLS